MALPQRMINEVQLKIKPIFFKIQDNFNGGHCIIVFYQLIMTQKNAALQLNLSKVIHKQWPKLPVYTSMINTKFSDTQRSDRYIPMEFREKRQTQARLDINYSTRDQRNNMSCIQNPFRKSRQGQQQTKRESGLCQTEVKLSNKCLQAKKTDRRIMTLREINTQIPKLRETNSTLCQSPKANQLLQTSKLSDFHKLKLLGRGKFGDVYLVKHYKTGFIAALKVINKRDLLDGNEEQNNKSILQLVQQIKIQSFMNHPNLIKLYEYFSDEECIYLLLELACDGHLFQFLQQNQTFTQETTSIVVREIVSGVDYMHKHNIIHRDIKLENIVLSHGMAKICDFGWSVYCPKQFRSTLCGTPLYLSPEILIGKHYNKKIDTWAIGALTHELITSENPFKIKHKDQLSKIVTQDFQMQLGSPQLRSFVTFILRKNPSKRPDTDTIKRHPFIQKYRDLQTSEELCQLIARNSEH